MGELTTIYKLKYNYEVQAVYITEGGDAQRDGLYGRERKEKAEKDSKSQDRKKVRQGVVIKNAEMQGDDYKNMVRTKGMIVR